MRTFVVFLIAISTLVTSCNLSNNVKIEGDLYARLVSSMIAEAAYENERASFSYKEAILELNDLAKARLSALQIGFKQLDSSRVKFNMLLEPIVTVSQNELAQVMVDKETVKNIVDLVLKENEEIHRKIAAIIQDDFANFGLKEEWKDELLKELSGIQSSIASDELLSGSNSEVSGVNSFLTLLVLQSFHNQVLRSYEEKLARLTYGHTSTILNAYFPVIVEATNGCLSRGDSLQMKIGVGNYSSLVSPSTIIIVDNDTLAVDDGGIATFNKKVVERGAHKLEIKCILFHPITGEVGMGQGEYNYRVN